MIQRPAHRLTVCHHQLKAIQAIEVRGIEDAFHHSMYGDSGNAERTATMRCMNHHVSSGFRICVINQDPEDISLFHRTHAWTTREESFHRSLFRSWISRRMAWLSNCNAYP